MTDAGDEPLGYLLASAGDVVACTEVTAMALEPVGLSFPQYICMRILSKSPGRSNADLGPRTVSVSPQAMNMVVRGLQDRGLVTTTRRRYPRADPYPHELTRDGNRRY